MLTDVNSTQVTTAKGGGMRPDLTAEMARVVVEDRVEAAERYRRRKEARVAAGERPDAFDAVIVRIADEKDGAALSRLARRARSLAHRLAGSYRYS
jgi:hypothetical protein